MVKYRLMTMLRSMVANRSHFHRETPSRTERPEEGSVDDYLYGCASMAKIFVPLFTQQALSLLYRLAIYINSL